MNYQATVNTVGDPTLNLWIDTGKSKSLKLIPKGAVVQVIGEVSTKWAKVTYAGLTGYCDRQYLVKVTDAPDAPNDPIDNTYLMPYIEAVESALNALKQAVRM